MKYIAGSIRWANADLPMSQRRRRWLNGKPTSGQGFVFAGILKAGEIFFAGHGA